MSQSPTDNITISESDLKGPCNRLNRKFSLIEAQITQVSNAVTSSGSTTESANAASFTNPMAKSGDMIYEGVGLTPARLAGNTANVRKFLRQQGTGTLSAAPAWDTLVAGDIPNLSSVYAPIGFPGVYANYYNLAASTSLSGNVQRSSAVLPAGQYLVMIVCDIVPTTGTPILSGSIAWQNPAGTVGNGNFGPGGTSSPMTSSAVYKIRTNGTTNLSFTTTLTGSATYVLTIDVMRLF